MTNQEQNYKITAIIKTCNCEDTLCDALESLRDLDEIIIIDEHSNDDTVEIAKEYKAKVIYADKNDLSIAINQAINEAQGEWIFVVEQDEIIPQRLILDLHNYVENPKKNRYCVSLAQKVFYLNKEIKAARSKNNLRFFKKGYAEFKNDNSFELKIKQGKLFKLNKKDLLITCENSSITIKNFASSKTADSINVNLLALYNNQYIKAANYLYDLQK